MDKIRGLVELKDMGPTAENSGVLECDVLHGGYEGKPYLACSVDIGVGEEVNYEFRVPIEDVRVGSFERETFLEHKWKEKDSAGYPEYVARGNSPNEEAKLNAKQAARDRFPRKK